MAGIDFLGNAYSRIENSYYGLLNWFEEKGIPLFRFNDILESRGIPGFPATLAIILIVVGGIAAFLFLSQGFSISVPITLQDQLGGELKGVQVTVQDQQSKAEIFSGAVSDGDKIELKGVHWGQKLEISAEKDGYESPSSQTYTVPVLNAEVEPITMGHFTRTKNMSSVQFKLVDSQNNTPIIGAEVTANFQGQDLITTVAEDGTVTLDGVPLGEQITLKVNADGYNPLEQPQSFDGTGIPTLNLIPNDEKSMGKSTLIVTVVEKETQVQVKGARIQVFNNTSESVISDVVSPDGFYTATIPKRTVIRLVVSAEGYAQYNSLDEGEPITLQADEVPLKVELKPGSMDVAMSVLAKLSGAELSGATVLLFDEQGKKLDEKITGFGGEAEFANLNSNATYYASAVREGYLPQRIKFVPSAESRVSFGLESATKSNSVTLGAFVSEASKQPANDATVIFMEQVDDEKVLPLGALDQKTDLSGYASAVVPVDKNIVVKASKGSQEAEGIILTKAFVANELRIVFPGATGIIALNVYDQEGNPLTEGRITITSDSGTPLFEGDLGNESIFFDAQGTKWIGIKVETADGQTYSEKVDVSGKDQVDFKIGAKESLGINPQINLLRIEDLEGKEAIGLTQGKEYYLVFETVWPSGEYAGGIHVRVGSDAVKFADSQGIGITGFMSEASGSFFGRSYHPSPLPGNEGIDFKNKGAGGKYNKFLEVYFTNPGGVKIVKVKVKVKETAKEESQQVHYRAWVNSKGAYYRTPEDEALLLSQYSPQKNGLYSKTIDYSVQVFESLPDCEGGICSEFKFVDSSGRQYEETGFQAVIGKVYALEVGLLSIQKDLGADVRVQTTNQAPLVGFTGFETGSFTQFADNEKTDTEISLGKIDLAKGSKTPLRIYFKARQAGSTFMKFIASSGGTTIAKQLYFNVASEGKMKLDYLQSISLGQALMLKVIDEKTSEAITNAQIRVLNPKGGIEETIIGNATNNRGLGGTYSFGSNYQAGAFTAIVSAPNYADEKLQFIVANDDAFQLPEIITINVLKGGQAVMADISLKNKLNQAISQLAFEVQSDSAWPEGMELLVQGPSTVDKKKEVTLKATASYSGNAETSHAEADVIVRGLAAGNFMVIGKTRAIVEYNRPFSADCLEFTPPMLSTYMLGTAGNHKTLEVVAKNNCPVPLDLDPEITSSTNAQYIKVQTSGMRIDRGKTATIRINVLNEMPLMPGSRARQERFDIYFKSDQLTKSLALQVNLWDPFYALDTSEDIIIWLSSYGGQKEAVAEVPLFMANVGPEPIFNLKATHSATNLQGVQLVINPSFPIQVLQPGQSLIPPLILRASTKQAKSQSVRSELIITGQIENQSFPLRKINLWFNISAPSCVEIRAPDPVEFVSNEPGYGTMDKQVKVFNHCSEDARIVSELSGPGGNAVVLDGGNEISLQPMGADTLAPNQSAEFKLVLEKKGAAKMDLVSVVGHAFLLGSQKWVDTGRLNIKLAIGQKELPQEMSGSSVQMKLCEKPEESRSIKFPKMAIGNDCANGYCDAEQLAASLVVKIADAVSQAKFKALSANKAAENTACDAQAGYCSFDDLGVKSQSFNAYFSNDFLSPDILTDALKKNDSLKGFDAAPYVGTTEEAMASIGTSGYQNRVFLSSNFSGCAKYSLRVNGTLRIDSGVIRDDAPNVFVEMLARQPTSECQKRIENFLNFIPMDASYTYQDRKGTWLGTTDSEQGLSEAAKTIASNLFTKPERYVQNSESNRVLLKLGDIKSIVRLEMGAEESSGPETITAKPETITATLNSAYKSATKDETKKSLADEAARAIKAFKDKGTEACISSDGKYIEVKSYTEVGKLRIGGCGASELAESIGSIALLPNLESNCELKVASEVEQSVTVKQIASEEDLGAGVKSVKLKAPEKQGDKEFKEFAEGADYLELDFNKQSKLFEKSIMVYVIGNNPTAPSNGNKLKVEASSAISNETISNARVAKEVSFKACAIHPLDLYTQLLTAKEGTYYATIQWKGGPEQFTSDELAKGLKDNGILKKTGKSVTSPENKIPLGFEAEEEMKSKKLRGIELYAGACFLACEACSALKTGGIGAVAGLSNCGLIVCGLPAGYAIGEVQGWWNKDLITKPFKLAKEAFSPEFYSGQSGQGASQTATSGSASSGPASGLPVDNSGTPLQSRPEEIIREMSAMELANTGILATVIGVDDIMHKVIDDGAKKKISERLATLVTKDLEKQVTPSALESIRKQLVPAISDKLPKGTKLTKEILKEAADNGLASAGEKGATITGRVAAKSTLGVAMAKAQGALLNETLNTYAQNSVYTGFNLPNAPAPKGATIKTGAITSGAAPVTVTITAPPVKIPKVASQITAKANVISKNMVNELKKDATITPAQEKALTKALNASIKTELQGFAGTDVPVDALQKMAAKKLQAELDAPANATIKTALKKSLLNSAKGRAIQEVGGTTLTQAESQLMRQTRGTRFGQGALKFLKSSKFWKAIVCGAAGEAGGLAAWTAYWKTASFENKNNKYLGNPTIFIKGMTYKFTVDEKAITPEAVTDFSKIPSNAEWIPKTCTGNEWDRELGFGGSAPAAPGSQGCSIDGSQPGIEDIPQSLENCAQYAELMDKYLDLYNLKEKGFDLTMAMSLAQQESSCNAPNTRGLFNIVGKNASKDPEEQTKRGLDEINDRLTEAQDAGFEGRQSIELALFGYNRGGNTMGKAMQKMITGTPQDKAMEDACIENYSQFGGCAGLNPKECCTGKGYGANYPDVVLARYDNACTELNGSYA